jgi:hypothetical protein
MLLVEPPVKLRRLDQGSTLLAPDQRVELALAAAHQLSIGLAVEPMRQPRAPTLLIHGMRCERVRIEISRRFGARAIPCSGVSSSATVETGCSRT